MPEIRDRTYVAYLVRKAGKHPGPNEITDIAKKRSALSALIRKFSLGAQRHLGPDILDLFDADHCTNYVPDNALDSDNENLQIIEDRTPNTENITLPLPSALPAPILQTLSRKDISKAELELRVGYANDLLDQLRLGVRERSMFVTETLQIAQGKKHGTRARTAIREVQRNIHHRQRLYNFNLAAMISLGLSDTLRKTYQVVEKEDLRPSPLLKTPNIRNESQQKLSWIWTMDFDPDNVTNNNYLEECRCRSIMHNSMLDQTMQITESIGSKPGLRRGGGLKKSSLPKTRWNGRFGILNIERHSGRPGTTMRPTPPDIVPMLSGNMRRGNNWKLPRVKCTLEQIPILSDLDLYKLTTNRNHDCQSPRLVPNLLSSLENALGPLSLPI